MPGWKWDLGSRLPRRSAAQWPRTSYVASRNLGGLVSKTWTITPPQGLGTNQHNPRQAFSRVVVHIRRSKIEANSWAMNITRSVLVRGSDAPNQKAVETGSLATLGGRRSRTRPADSRAWSKGALRPGAGASRRGLPPGSQLRCPHSPAFGWLPGPLPRWGVKGPRGEAEHQQVPRAPEGEGERGEEKGHLSAAPSLRPRLELCTTWALGRGLPWYPRVRIFLYPVLLVRWGTSHLTWVCFLTCQVE